MEVLVCGGRDFLDDKALRRGLTIIHNTVPITKVIEGGANGADRLARAWAEDRDIPVTTVPAKWTEHGKSAGYRRNVEMIELEPDLVVAFPGGKGTSMMVDIALERRITVVDYRDISAC